MAGRAEWCSGLDRVMLVGVRRVLLGVVVVLVLYAVITQPQGTAAMTRSGAGHVMTMGHSLTQFMTALSAGQGTTSGRSGSASSGPSPATATTTTPATSATGASRQMPVGGVDTGDGSTAP